MLEKAFGQESHGGPEVIPQGHGGWHDAWLFSGHGEASGLGHSALHGSSHHASTEPSDTLVGSPGGLQIHLLWDPSVAGAPSGFKDSVTAAATTLTQLFSNSEIINLQVGWGEVGGTPMSSNEVGASVMNGYLFDYATVAHAVQAPAAGNDPTTSEFFVTTADAKALGLANPSARVIDGSVGFGSSWSYSMSPGAIGPHQFDLQAVAQHEITEVMGRLGTEGQIVGGVPAHTPLDLFSFSAPGALELSANGGYFSNDAGHTNLGTYNNAALNGGDIGDWASINLPAQSGTITAGASGYDTFDAFMPPGASGQITPSDIAEMAALGYTIRTV
jgi:hypothetical protein